MRWSEICLLFYCCCSGHFKIPAYLPACLPVCLLVGDGACSYMWGSKDWHQVSSLIISLRQSLTEPEFANSANLAGQKAPEILLSPPPQAYTIQVCFIYTVMYYTGMYYTGIYYTWLSYMSSGELNTGLHTCTLFTDWSTTPASEMHFYSSPFLLPNPKQSLIIPFGHKSDLSPVQKPLSLDSGNVCVTLAGAIQETLLGSCWLDLFGWIWEVIGATTSWVSWLWIFRTAGVMGVLR